MAEEDKISQKRTEETSSTTESGSEPGEDDERERCLICQERREKSAEEETEPESEPEEDNDEGETCPICQDILLLKGKAVGVMLLGCGHVFHWHCLLEWIKLQWWCCPFCREGLNLRKCNLHWVNEERWERLPIPKRTRWRGLFFRTSNNGLEYLREYDE
ncbi:hypothetical protein B0T21DRAFT_345650 [Apiosordaria backusii]|uniref:RING-type domain-containing protein n=1 Tax=Apiosordaria backusii TaxID=314023 RepID=A0AA40K0X3_9PEZI|nr:hypothetical protein B0T21DRAFT_345650 [Apiosordaria backusii]